MTSIFPTVQPLPTYKTASPTTAFSTMTESLISASFPITNTVLYLLQAIWTGTPVGTIAVVGSLDNINYNIPIYSIAAGGTGGSLAYDLYGTAVQWVRIAYTFSSGTGTLTCNGSTKV